VQQVSDAVLGPVLANALADELVALTDTLSALACDLGSNIEIVRRHMTALQAVDQISQVQLAMADILRGSGSDSERVSGVRLEALAERLRAALQPPRA
jgi:hypothetical protein